MKRIRLGFIAAGARNRVYARNLLRQFGDRIEFTAVCDVDHNALQRFQKEFKLEDTALYRDYKELLDHHRDFDGLIIAPPNHLHEEVTIPALEFGIPLLLEKPLAHTAESCMNIARAYDSSKTRVTMGFVLRYTPFYRTVARILREGRIGKVKVLNADEVVGPVLSSVFFRTWRGKEECTGGMLLEKCCHDLDLINSMLEVDPVQVSAFGSNNHFHSRPGLGPRCPRCKISNTCAFSTVWWGKNLDPNEDNGENLYVDFTNDMCVYNDEHDIQDRQSQIVEYEGGVLVFFNATLGGPDTRRTIDITGTEGRLFGDFRENRILLYQAYKEKPQEMKIEHERSGHGGGDSVLIRSFIESIENPDYKPEATFKDGLKSALLAFLCDKSRSEEKVLPVRFLKEIEELRD